VTFSDRSEKLLNDVFVNLLDVPTTWKPDRERRRRVRRHLARILNCKSDDREALKLTDGLNAQRRLFECVSWRTIKITAALVTVMV
jgi:predicted component of type VI protein secretion system